MNILITGGQGFLGRSFTPILSQKHTVFAPSHKELDILDLELLTNFVRQHNINCIIHAATILSREYSPSGLDAFYLTLRMFENVARQNIKLLINFGSGEESDRPNQCEDYIRSCVPPKISGLSKSIITQRLLSLPYPAYNLRFAGYFGPEELNNRFFKSNLKRIINREPIVIYQDRIMDFISIYDLLLVVESIINRILVYQDINCAYLYKIKLSEIAKTMLTLTKSTTPIIIEQPNMNDEYTIDGNLLYSCRLGLSGLEDGIRRMYEALL